MVKIEVRIISREIFKPSSPTTQYKKSYELSMFDQLTPTTYTPLIFFYPVNNANSSNNIAKTRINQLKKSLPEALDIYYPLSGRVYENRFIDCFNEGVPFFEAQVNCRLSDFLKHIELETLNSFLPYRPFTNEDMNTPIVALQVNMFTCGGMALACSASHKLIDGVTARAIFTTWASVCRGDHNDLLMPDFSEASHFFPPRDSFPRNHLSLVENLWRTEGPYITRRFVFNAKALATLKAKVKAVNPDSNPSRTKALTCFIWKCSMAASRAISGSPKPSILVEAVDLRRRTKPPMSFASTGNVFWWATALVNPKGPRTELHELVNILNEATELYDSDFTQTLQGKEGFETLSEYFNQLEDLFSIEKPDIFAFTYWSYLGFTKVDFGWGEPLWVGLMGKVGPAFRNLTILVETKDGTGIEAWVTLDEQRMSLLERDPDFLAFASPNPKISSL